MVGKRGRRPLLRKGCPFLFILLPLLLCGQTLSAESGASEDQEGPSVAVSEHRGFYCAVPAYLYGGYSAGGLQFGYQAQHLHVRLEASCVGDFQEEDAAFFFNPSLGIFGSKDFESRLRIYEGFTFGVETGMVNSFSGQVYSLNFLLGAEWFVHKRKAFFLEIGTGLGILPKDGAFNGGTIIGGGLKTYF